MLKKEKKIVVTFYTSSEAMALEKVCKKNSIKGELISAPREITSDCGISYAAEISEKVNIEKLLKDNKIDFDSIYEIDI